MKKKLLVLACSLSYCFSASCGEMILFSWNKSSANVVPVSGVDLDEDEEHIPYSFYYPYGYGYYYPDTDGYENESGQQNGDCPCIQKGRMFYHERN